MMTIGISTGGPTRTEDVIELLDQLKATQGLPLVLGSDNGSCFVSVEVSSYLEREQVAEAWRETRQVFLVIEGGGLAEWTAYLHLGPERSKPIGTCGSRVILANR